MTITNLSNPVITLWTDFPQGAIAAARAVTKSCELGRPVQIISCDDRFDPNNAATCARQAVADKVLAVVTYGGNGNSILPIVAAAGIPSIGNNASASDENTSKLSFPVEYPVSEVLGEASMAVSLGATNIAMPELDVPAVNFWVGLVKAQVKQFGAKVTVIPVQPTATDMTSYAGQVLSSGATGVVLAIPSAQTVSLVKDLKAQGANLQHIKVIGPMDQMTQQLAGQLGSNANGLYGGGAAWSPTDTSNPAIQQYLSELKAAGEPTSSSVTSTLGVIAWGTVHMIADALKGQQVSSKELIARLNAPGVADANTYGLPPINYTQNAFPTNPQLAKLRLFTDTVSGWEFVGGVARPLSKGWLTVTAKMSIKPLN
jgi:ABC-type branched-subunit amino acid transport system substrate-binding protein